MIPVDGLLNECFDTVTNVERLVLPMRKQTAVDLRAWLALREAATTPELLLNARDEPMTRAGFEYVLLKHAQTSFESCPSLRDKRIHPHLVRHYLPFPTISCNDRVSAATPGICCTSRVDLRSNTRHSFPGATDC